MNITYPATFPFADADVVESANLRDIIYNTADADGALSIINGNMDWRNIGVVGVSDDVVKRDHIQRGALAQGWAATGTANLDYRYNWFSDYETDADTFDKTASSIAQGRIIPGGARTFFVNSARAADMIRISWNIMWTNDNGWLNDPGDTAKGTHIYLKIVPRGAAAPDAEDGQVREVNRTVSGTGATRAHEGNRKNRYWCGHHLAPLATGWYTAALHIIQDKEIKQARVWARSLIVRRSSLKASG